MVSIRNIFTLFVFFSSASLSWTAQISTAKSQLIDSLATKLLDNIQFSEYSIKRITTTSSCKSEPSISVTITLVSLTNKRIKAVLINSEGVETQNVFTSSNIGSPLVLQSNSNNCFRVYQDADNSESESIYINLPSFRSTYFIGELAAAKQWITDSGWTSNPDLNLQHLQQLKNLFDNKKSVMNNQDLNLIRTTYYDDSPETNTQIQSFFDSFDSTNKFIDPLFNPMNKIKNENYSPKRISENIVKSLTFSNASENSQNEFNFKLTNDVNVDFKVYWVNFLGNLKYLGSLSSGQSDAYSAYIGYVYLLATSEKIYICEIGKSPFITPNANVDASRITNIQNFNEYVKETFVEPILVNKTNFEVYNSRQGRIGDCWFLSMLVAIFTRYPEQIVSKFIKPELMNKTGVVAVKLWSHVNNAWRLVIMDDYLPQTTNSDKTSWYTAGPSGLLKNRYWVPFIEKAFAKQITSFESLTGGLVTPISVSDAYRMILGPLFIGQFTAAVPQVDNDNSAYNQILENYKTGSLITFSSRNTANGELADKTTCIVGFHGYSLLEIKENVANTGLSFVKIQNPWSKGGEWCGDWGDSSSLWDQYPNIKTALNFVKKDDGIFWMEKKDVYKPFAVLWITNVFRS